MITRENVGAEVSSSDAVIGSVLDGGPPLRIKKSLGSYPIRNSLLGKGRAFKKRSNAVRQRHLAPSNINGLLQGGNVLLLHDGKKSTRNLVNVKKNLCFISNQEPCTVLDMSTHQKKAALTRVNPPLKRAKTAPEKVVGPDGMTMPQRVRMLMVDSGTGQSELARSCSEIYATYNPGIDDKVKQQNIFNLLQGQRSAWCLPLIAMVFDVNDLWLQLGIGPRERSRQKRI